MQRTHEWFCVENVFWVRNMYERERTSYTSHSKANDKIALAPRLMACNTKYPFTHHLMLNVSQPHNSCMSGILWKMEPTHTHGSWGTRHGSHKKCIYYIITNAIVNKIFLFFLVTFNFIRALHMVPAVWFIKEFHFKWNFHSNRIIQENMMLSYKTNSLVDELEIRKLAYSPRVPARTICLTISKLWLILCLSMLLKFQIVVIYCKSSPIIINLGSVGKSIY